MHMNHISRTGALVQIIDILGDEQKLTVKIFFKLRQRPMGAIELNRPGQKLLAPAVIEAMHEVGIRGETLRRSDLLDPVTLPQAV